MKDLDAKVQMLSWLKGFKLPFHLIGTGLLVLRCVSELLQRALLPAGAADFFRISQDCRSFLSWWREGGTLVIQLTFRGYTR